MALSNIRKEPRREITESVVGFLGIIVIMILDYQAAIWIEHSVNPTKQFDFMDTAPIMAVVLVVGVLTTMFGIAILYGTHALGEIICGALAKRGLDPRPKQRYR